MHIIEHFRVSKINLFHSGKEDLLADCYFCWYLHRFCNLIQKYNSTQNILSWLFCHIFKGLFIDKSHILTIEVQGLPIINLYSLQPSKCLPAIPQVWFPDKSVNWSLLQMLLYDRCAVTILCGCHVCNVHADMHFTSITVCQLWINKGAQAGSSICLNKTKVQ